MNLFEYLSMHGEAELEIGDNTWDCMTNVYWGKEFQDVVDGTSDDWYYKFMVAFYRHCNIVKLHNQSSAVVDITGVVQKFKTELVEVMKNRWRYQYDPEDEEFEYQWVNELCLYMNGEIVESMSKILVDIFDKERLRWEENHTVEGD